MHYLEAGGPGSTTVVFLHGYPVDARLWRRCLGPLSGSLHVIAPDLPGHGRTDGHPGVDHDADYYVEWLASFYEALGLQAPHLVAHDLGGMVALAFAGRHSDRIGRFVLMDTAPYPREPWSMRLALRLFTVAPLRRLVLTRQIFRLVLQRTTPRNSEVLDRLVNLYLPTWTATALRRCMFGEVCRLPLARLCPSREDLSCITAPTLILWADEDPLFPVSVSQRLQRDLPQAELVIAAGSSHFVPEEKPDLVEEQVRRFLVAHAQG